MNEWIKVQDQLPEKEMFVLMYSKYMSIEETKIGYLSLDGKFWNDDHGYTIPCVTHWSHLPKIPKE